MKDVRRRPAEAALVLVVIMAASTTLTLGLALRGVTGQPCERTQAATAGPDDRALGASPRQVMVGLAAVQLLPALPGALAGIPVGIGRGDHRAAVASHGFGPRAGNGIGVRPRWSHPEIQDLLPPRRGTPWLATFGPTRTVSWLPTTGRCLLAAPRYVETMPHDRRTHPCRPPPAGPGRRDVRLIIARPAGEGASESVAFEVGPDNGTRTAPRAVNDCSHVDLVGYGVSHRRVSVTHSTHRVGYGE